MVNKFELNYIVIYSWFSNLIWILIIFNLVDLNTPIISAIIDSWIDEDIGRGDLTSSSITEESGNAYWIAKGEGIFCGVDIIKEIF